MKFIFRKKKGPVVAAPAVPPMTAAMEDKTQLSSVRKQGDAAKDEKKDDAKGEGENTAEHPKLEAKVILNGDF